MILASMGAAVAMLFTPCVFPMIPITVSFFLKQSEREHHNALATAAVYSLTIIVVLALSVLVLGQLIVTLANNAWLNLALGGVLVFFALSLFGMYEIELPSGLARFTSAREGKGGYAGAFFMALTFTITSFTCTGPFLGPLLVGVKELKLSPGELVISSAGILGDVRGAVLCPGVVSSAAQEPAQERQLAQLREGRHGLPGIGRRPQVPWQYRYRPQPRQPPHLQLRDGAVCLDRPVAGVWFVSCLAPSACRTIRRLKHIGVVRMLLATIFIGLALYMAPALWRDRPLGAIGEGLVAFLPLDTKEKMPGAGGSSGQVHLDWHKDYEKAWKQAIQENKLIFIDFTGVNCTNCRDNEQRVFPRPDVRQALEKYVRVQLYTDSVPIPGLSSAEATAEAKRNQGWQAETFGDVTTPYYAIIQPAKDKPFSDGKLNGTVLGTKGGTIPNNEIGQFVSLLRTPLNGQVARAK